MEAGFFTSKPFVASAIVAILIIAGGATIYRASSVASFGFESGCDDIALVGGAKPAVVADEQSANARTLTLDGPVAPQGGAVELCVVVGEIVVSRSSGEKVELIWRVHGPSGSIATTIVEASFASRDGRVLVAAWESQVGRAGTLMSRSGADVSLDVRLPDGLWDVRASTNVGDVRVSDVRVGNVSLSADVGNVVATKLESEGNTSIATSVGEVTLHFDSVQTSRIRVETSVDGIEIRLPQRADVGYKVHALADVGEVDVDIGPTERMQSEHETPGAEIRAQSAGYDSKPTRVEIEAVAEVGDVTVKSP